MGNGTFRPRLGLFNLRQLEQDMVLVQCARMSRIPVKAFTAWSRSPCQEGIGQSLLDEPHQRGVGTVEQHESFVGFDAGIDLVRQDLRIPEMKQRDREPQDSADIDQ